MEHTHSCNENPLEHKVDRVHLSVCRGCGGTVEMTQAFKTQRPEQLHHLLSLLRGSFLN